MPAVRAMPINRRVAVVFMRSSWELPYPMSPCPISGGRCNSAENGGDAGHEHALPPAGNAQLAIGLISAERSGCALVRRNELAEPALGARRRARSLHVGSPSAARTPRLAPKRFCLPNFGIGVRHGRKCASTKHDR